MGCSGSKPAQTASPQKSIPKYAKAGTVEGEQAEVVIRPRSRSNSRDYTTTTVVPPNDKSESGKFMDIASAPDPTPGNGNGPHANQVIPVTKTESQGDLLHDSVTKIQRLARRKSSRNQIREAQEWKIFNDIDLQDEAQMLMLANFMQTLIDANLPQDECRESPLEPDEANLERMAQLHQKDPTLCVDDINFSFNEGSTKMSGKNTMNFSIPKGPITPETVVDVMQLYKKGGKLSPLAVQNILRQAYKFLKQESNIKRLTVSSRERLAIVGDLHGQIKDLLFILDENGLPSPTNKYIFNGDFVDRGTSGVEVLVLLMCLYCAYPGCVNLNRGNHEDYAVCCVYGFQTECTANIVNDAILVVHGGLFHEEKVTIADIEAIDRRDYKVSTESEDDEFSAESSRANYLQRLFRDALWSDPHAENTLLPNTRGSGVLFGPNHTRTFLDLNNLSMIVRSHECVRGGVAFPFHGADKDLLCTVFSASNYGGSGNQAAYMVLTTHVMSDSKPVRNSNLQYSVQSFTTSLIKQVSLETKNRLSMKELLCRRRRALKLYFESKDESMSGLVSFSDWAFQMAEVTGLKILWIPLIRTIVPEPCIEGANIRYEPFLESLTEGQEDFQSEADISSLYGPVEQLELIFKFFDKNGDGKISRSEFKTGCDHLNSTLPEQSQFKDVDQLLKMLDLDGDDNIDKNELFEMFRHLDAKDGVVDGIISVASKYSAK